VRSSSALSWIFMSKDTGLLWESFRHLLAVVVTALTFSAIPAVVAMVVGALAVFSGVILTVLLTLYSDPPVFGLILGAEFTLAIAVVTLALLLLVLSSALVLSGLIIMPIILLIRFSFDHWQIRSRRVAVVTYLLAGSGVGFSLGGVVHLIALIARWPLIRFPWLVVGSYASCLSVGVLAITVYNAVLLGSNAALIGVRSIAKSGTSKRQLVSE
jgi:hypothetical protein